MSSSPPPPPPPPGLNLVKVPGSFYILHTPTSPNQMDKKTEWRVLIRICSTTPKNISENINSFLCNWQFVSFMYWLMQIGARQPSNLVYIFLHHLLTGLMVYFCCTRREPLHIFKSENLPHSVEGRPENSFALLIVRRVLSNVSWFGFGPNLKLNSAMLFTNGEEMK